MTIASVLSAIPGIRLDFSKSTVNNIHIGGDYISNNGEIIGGKEEASKILKALESSKDEDSLPVQLTDIKLLSKYTQAKDNLISNSEMKILKEVLPKEEMKAVIFAKSIYNSMVAMNPRDDILKSISDLEEIYPKKGRRILNLMGSGYFETLVIPMINYCKEKDSKKFKENFMSFYFSILSFFPTAIFVNKATTPNDIYLELKKRLKLKTVPQIKIHAIGRENIITKDDSLQIIRDKIESKINIDTELRKNLGRVEHVTTIDVIKNFE